MFTGSDWCPACRDLHDVVFNDPAWSRWAADNVVLAWVDHPRDAALVPEPFRARNEMLLAMYGSFAFLPIVLAWLYMSWQIVLLGECMVRAFHVTATEGRRS